MSEVHTLTPLQPARRDSLISSPNLPQLQSNCQVKYPGQDYLSLQLLHNCPAKYFAKFLPSKTSPQLQSNCQGKYSYQYFLLSIQCLELRVFPPLQKLFRKTRTTTGNLLRERKQYLISRFRMRIMNSTILKYNRDRLLALAFAMQMQDKYPCPLS